MSANSAATFQKFLNLIISIAPFVSIVVGILFFSGRAALALPGSRQVRRQRKRRLPSRELSGIGKRRVPSLPPKALPRT